MSPEGALEWAIYTERIPLSIQLIGWQTGIGRNCFLAILNDPPPSVGLPPITKKAGR